LVAEGGAIVTAEQAEQEFSRWLSEQDFGEHQIIADGEWHNVDLPGDKPGSKKGSVKLVYGDRIEGVFKTFNGIDPIVWHPGNGATVNFTDEERRALAAEAERKALRKKKAQEASRTKAETLYRQLPVATPEHLYLLKKKIKEVGELKVNGEDLIVPIYNARTDEFLTLQRIKPDGTKLFPKNAVKAGGYTLPGLRPRITKVWDRDGPIVICEGYATAYAIRSAISPRYRVIAALDCGNLKVVAEILHDRFPLREFIIAADNDIRQVKKLGFNPGIRSATEAALAIGRKIAVPPPQDANTSGDFWDLWDKEGDPAVKKLIDEASEPLAEDALLDGAARWEGPDETTNEASEPLAEAAADDATADDAAAATAANVAVANLNKDYALVIVGDKVAVMNTSGEGISFMNVGAFETWFMNRYVRTRSGARKPLGKFWMTHPARRQYKGLVFSPHDCEVRGHYNLWRGFAAEPRQGDCTKFLAHIHDNVCSGDTALSKWVLGWFADIIQHPDKKIGTSLVLRGKQGTGKTIVGKIIGSILGRHYFAISDPRLITGRFNAHLTACLLLHADEAFWAGDHAAERKLKDLVTGDDHYIEFKGKEVIKVRNYVRLFVSGNPDWLVPAAMDERRSAVIDVGEGHMQDNDYFAAIEAEADNGGREALLHYLQTFDLKSVNLRKIPLTAALLDQKILSMTAEQKWWFDMLSSGELPGGCLEVRHCPVPVLFEKYILHASRQGAKRRSIETQLGAFLHKHVPGLRKLDRKPYNFKLRGRDHDHQREGYIYVFPSLAECRKAFADELKQELKWDNQLEWVTGLVWEFWVDELV
jgi:phage/plasmid primase-like uncharacterized protein